MKPSDIKPGDRFGRLVVQSIQQHYRNGRKNGFEAVCLCDCGNQKIVTLSQLRTDNAKSCGCARRDQSRYNMKNVLEKTSRDILDVARRKNLIRAHESLREDRLVRSEILFLS